MRNKLLTRDRMKFQRKLFRELEPDTAISLGVNGAKSHRIFVVKANSCIRDEDKHLFETGRVIANESWRAAVHPDLEDIAREILSNGPEDPLRKAKGLIF